MNPSKQVKEASLDEFKQKLKEGNWKVIVLLFVILLTFGYALFGGGGESGGGSGQDAQHVAASEDLSVEARTMSQIMVEQTLKAPVTADFPWFAQEINKGISGDPNFYKVRSYVDSENSFGANVRTDWMTMVRYDGTGDPADNSNWEFIYLRVGGEKLIDKRAQ